MPAQLQIPADFAEHSQDFNDSLRARYGVCNHTLSKWRRSIGVTIIAKRRRIEIPADFAELAPLHMNVDLAARYGVTRELISVWRERAGIAPFRPRRAVREPSCKRNLPMPADFRDRAPSTPDAHLCRIYDRALKTIRRWRAESGIPLPARHQSQSLRHHPVRLVPGQVVLPSFRNMTPTMHGGREEEAAQFLRHYAAVYRCTERGGADQKGSHWRFGNAVMTPAEMIERAVRKGWDADAWRRVA